ncbi:MAG TPA: formate dehydrogenase subunit alpha [Polyangiaceae bacterium]|nr:formate dehydrogenase subunit alpha [Polyangiaceae bacterium]
MLTVDAIAVEAAGSVLDACRRAGADVPAFCHDDRLPAAGHCRACLVEVDGRVVAACTTRARPGQCIVTDSPRLREYRRDLGELMLSEAQPGGAVGTELATLGATGARYSLPARAGRRDTTHSHLRLNLERCILCRQCVRVCEEVQGRFVFALAGRGAETRLAWSEGPFSRSSCVACGACVQACPSGALSDIDRDTSSPTIERTVRTTCGYCGVGCQLDVHVRDGDVARVDGAPSPVNRGHLCVKGRYAHGVARHPERLTSPLVRENGALVPASWDEALARVTRELAARRGKVAALSSSRCTNEENYLLQKWARVGLGTNDVDCCARVCHAPSAAGMRHAFGTGAATNSLADIERADAILLAGSNATASHPIIGARIEQAVLEGAKLIVIDPRRTELARLADVHLQLRPGANVPLLNALAAVIVEEDLVDRAFVAARATGFERYAEFVRRFAPESCEELTGVLARDVRRAARLYAGAARPMQLHGLGITEHYQGSETVMLLCNLALLVGAVGREGVGVNPLRGQNNVQGAADMGCSPDLLTGYADVRDPAVRARFAAVWGCPLPPLPGRTLPQMYDAIRDGALTALFILGEDVVQTDPNSNQVVADLEKLEFLVVQELFLTQTAKLAHVVLPGASFLEKDGTFTNGERRIQRVRRVLPAPGAARADWQILAELLQRAGCPGSYASPADVLLEVGRVAPPFAGVRQERLDGDGLQWPVPSPDHPGTPILHRESFPIERARLTCVEYVPSPALANAPGHFLLITGRALEHYNNGSMTRLGSNIARSAADAIGINPRDAHRLDISPGDALTLESAFGTATGVADVSDDVAPRTLFMTFHFPESHTNRLTSDVRDRIADCPEYKLTPVTITRAASRPASSRRPEAQSVRFPRA